MEEEGGKGREREKGRSGSPEGRRPATRYAQTSLEFCLPCPVHLCTKKATTFEPPQKKTKKSRKKQEKRKFEQSEHWFVTTKCYSSRPKWHLHRPRRHAVLTTVLNSAKMPRNTTKKGQFGIQKSSKTYLKTWQNRQFAVQKLTKRGSYVSENLSASKLFAFT